jgi:hypothetical protein
MFIVRMASAGRGGGNSAENRGPNYYVQRYNLNSTGRQQLHRALGALKAAGEEITDEVMDQEAAEIADHSKWVNPEEPQVWTR